MNHDPRRMVGCGLLRSVEDGQVSSWICHWADAFHFSGILPHYPVGAQVHPQVGKGQPGGAAYAFSEMEHHMSMLREWYAHFADLSPGMAGLGACESLFTHLEHKKIATEQFLVRHFSADQQALETQE